MPPTIAPRTPGSSPRAGANRFALALASSLAAVLVVAIAYQFVRPEPGEAVGVGEPVVEEGGVPAWIQPILAEPDESQRPALVPRLPEGVKLSILEGREEVLVTDPWVYFRRPENRSRVLHWREHPDGEFVRATGVAGLRLTGPLPAQRPEPLIVLTGDSHMDGVCAEDETAAAVLEANLALRPGVEAVRVLNAGVGQYTFPHYLAVAWRYLELAPDVLVVVVFGGNDFGAIDSVEAELAGEPEPVRPAGYDQHIQRVVKTKLAGRRGGASLWQALNQVYLFEVQPELETRSVERSLVYLEEIDRMARARGTRFIAAYLPPMHDVREEFSRNLYASLFKELEIDESALASSNRVADAMLAGLEARGIETVDARPTLREWPGHLYWVADEHLNTVGHRLLGELLAQRLAEPRAGE
ncbi:SGNH/GDSL hydrolase family protein [Engelhardtia mirabilis]|uniref:SGNH hydrolase-type esterase domain-containing protein n=1 Tax=Engelhardtia mirabilis TaxID=2528011 RepID=A0A518BLR4_9BACT|nr:hypothetical protein Pla133_30080 [Planctomycetes bacterium Pla133]QDV02245.1 hypothetical protein Pla86_30070 [Planctomycetes bacterium Pla86]